MKNQDQLGLNMLTKVEQALSADLIRLCEQAGAQFHKVQGSYRSHCPLHGGDGKNNFSIYQDAGKLKWKCHSANCGQGDVIDFVMVWKNLDLKGAIQYLTGDEAITPEEAVQFSSERAERAQQWKEQKEQEYKDALHELWRARAWEMYYHNLLVNNQARRLWNDRGVPDVFQDIWQLGYTDKFSYYTDAGRWISPSLVIPIFAVGQDEPINIRHRILNPANPTDKYRPERAGLRSAPFIADPQNEHERVLVVEGEIKAMVSYIALDDSMLQVYGVPGKNNFSALMDTLKDREVYILFDPDAGEQAVQAARDVKGKVINLKIKVDDAINAGYLIGNDLRRLMMSARRY